MEKTSLISSFDFFSPRPDCINLGLVSHCLYYPPSVRGRQRPSGSLGDWFQIAPVIEANNWPSRGRPLNSQAEPKFDRGPQPVELVKIHLLLIPFSLSQLCVSLQGKLPGHWSGGQWVTLPVQMRWHCWHCWHAPPCPRTPHAQHATHTPLSSNS